jgi:hypothetical protein
MFDQGAIFLRSSFLAAAVLAPAVSVGEPCSGDPATKLAEPLPATPAAVSAVPDAAASAAGTVQGTSAWVNCAKNSKTCRITPTGLVTLRYGGSDSYTYVNIQGIQELKCTDFWGNPEKDTDKFCDYSTQNLLGVSADSSFSTVAAEGSSFSVSGEGLFWVRFGLGSSWIYTLIEGGSNQEMPCSKDYFGIDPAKKQKKECQVGSAYSAQMADFGECATEGNTCAAGTSVVVARYGAGTGYDTRFVHQGDAAFTCNGNFFGNDPAKKQYKACAIQAMPAQNVETLGVWQKVTSCDGPDCPIEYRLVVGTSRTNSWTTTD